jgi:hypothetical protein
MLVQVRFNNMTVRLHSYETNKRAKKKGRLAAASF